MRWLHDSTAASILVVLVLVVAPFCNSVKADFTLGTPENLGSIVNSSIHDMSAIGLSASELALVYWRQPPGNSDDYEVFLTARATRNDPWGVPVSYGQLKHGESYEVPEVVVCNYKLMTPDLLEGYFPSRREGGVGGMDLWMIQRETVDGVWGEPNNLGPIVNSVNDDWAPCLSPDGLEIYFCDDSDAPRSGGHGSVDIWVTKRAAIGAPWTAPVNLGPQVNTSGWDSAPFVSDDGRTLLIDSRRGGGYGDFDLYISRRVSVNEPWSKAVNLGSVVSTESYEENPQLSSDGTTLYWGSSRPGGYGRVDLWQVAISPVVDFNGDGRVNAKDMSILVDCWYTSDPLCDIGPTPMGDGIVDEKDLLVLAEHLEPGMGRIAHWKLDEEEGEVALDCVGPYDAEVIGEAMWQPGEGILDGALQLDGVENHLAPALVLNPQDGPFRITAWIQGGAPGQVIASQAPEGSADFDFLYLAADPEDGTLMTTMILPTAPLDSHVVITDGQWHEVGFEWDGDYRHLTVDGVEVVDELKMPAYVFDQSGRLDIGKGKPRQADTYWSGLIDEVKVFKKGIEP